MKGSYDFVASEEQRGLVDQVFGLERERKSFSDSLLKYNVKLVERLLVYVGCAVGSNLGDPRSKYVVEYGNLGSNVYVVVSELGVDNIRGLSL